MGQVVGSVDCKLGRGDTGLVELGLALGHEFGDEALVGTHAPDLDILLNELDESLGDEVLEERAVLFGALGLLAETVLGLLLDPLDHVEAHLHLHHPALIDLPALEDFLCDLDAVLQLLEVLLVVTAGLILDPVHLVVLLLLALFLNLAQLVLLVLLNEGQEALDPLVGNPLEILIHRD